jgi:signal transduction histidine kinase
MKLKTCKYFLIIVAAVSVTIISSVCTGQNYHNRHARYSVSLPVNQRIRLKDSLVKILNSSTIAKDNLSAAYKRKVNLLLNICDLSVDDSSMFAYADKLYNMASKQHDLNGQIDALVILCTDEQPELQRYLNVALRLPKNNRSREISELFRYRILINSKEAATDNSRTKLIKELIKKYSQNVYSNDYERVGDLLVLCKLISLSTRGELYSKYIAYADKAIKALPPNGGNILSLFYYTQSATFYASHDMQKEALAADMQLLKIYNILEASYKSQGRAYLTMNQYRYLCYRRLLTYSRVLSGKQLDMVFKTLKELAAADPVLYNDLYASNSIGLARYYYGKKEYKKAIPYLDAAIKSNADSLQWRMLETLKMRVKAGVALNDTTNLHESLVRYANYLKKSKEAGITEKEAELEVLYDLSHMRERANNRLLFLIIMSVVILVLAIAVVFRLLMRSRRMKSSLKSAQQKLQEEKKIISSTMVDLMKAEDLANKANNLKTMFLQNMSHEVRTPLNSIIGFSQLLASSGKEMSPSDAAAYVDLISKNSNLLITIISDVLDISTIETGEMKFIPTDFSANEICTASIKSVEKNVRPGVSISFCKHENDVKMFADIQRVQQVILNYLTNACKFTEKGSIVLDYFTDSDKITFSVTDTGIGIPEDKMDLIFNRFEKLNTFSQGTGLGLNICRLIANKLKGKAFIDKNYRGGSRFLFEIPIKESSIDDDKTR